MPKEQGGRTTKTNGASDQGDRIPREIPKQFRRRLRRICEFVSRPSALRESFAITREGLRLGGSGVKEGGVGGSGEPPTQIAANPASPFATPTPGYIEQ